MRSILAVTAGFPIFWIQQLLDVVRLWLFHSVGERFDWPKHPNMQNAPAFTSLQLVATRPLELNHEAESAKSHAAAATNALTAVQSNAWDSSSACSFFVCFLLIQIVPISEDNCMVISI